MDRLNLIARRLAAASLLAAAAVALAVAALVISPAPGRADPALDSEESQFLVLINTYRAQNGLGPLAIQTQLNASADWLSTDMAAKNYFSHTDSLGRNPSQRAAAFGYPYGAGENAACGFTTAQAVFEGWKGSPGHNLNMLNSSYKVIGIGRAYAASTQCGIPDIAYFFPAWYWTTDFGLVVTGTTVSPTPSATPAGTPSPTHTPTPAPTPTPTAGPTRTPAPTLTASPTPTPTPAPTLTASPTHTPTPAPTPTPTPTPAPTPAPTATPTPAPTPTPTSTPTPPVQPGDVDCDGAVTSADALEILRYQANLEVSQQPGCPAIGGSQPAGAPSQHIFGDVDCGGGVDGVDALDVLRYVGRLPVSLPGGCPGIGDLG